MLLYYALEFLNLKNKTLVIHHLVGLIASVEK